MKITCPACSTSYMVPDTAIGEKGRKVKCASCAHSWHQDPPASPSDAPTTDISQEAVEKAEAKGSNVPAIKEYDPVPGKLVAATIIIFILGYFINDFAQSPEGYGVQKTDGLVFNKIDVEIKREANRLAAYITGEVKNESDDEDYAAPPELHIKLWSGQKRVMAETTYEMPEKTLAPGEAAALTPRIGNISGNANQLVVDLGNGMERFFRE